MPDQVIGIDLASQTGQESIADAISSLSNIVENLNVSNNDQSTFVLSNQSSPIRGLINLSSTWSGSDPYTQTISLDNIVITKNTKIDLQLTSLLLGQLINDNIKAVWIQNDNGILTAYMIGGYPTTSLAIPCIIYETDVLLIDISIDTLPTKLVYTVGDSLDFTGLVIKATYSDGSIIDITSDCIFNHLDGEILSDDGEMIISVGYLKNGIIKVESFVINVNPSLENGD